MAITTKNIKSTIHDAKLANDAYEKAVKQGKPQGVLDSLAAAKNSSYSNLNKLSTDLATQSSSGEDYKTSYQNAQLINTLNKQVGKTKISDLTAQIDPNLLKLDPYAKQPKIGIANADATKFKNIDPTTNLPILNQTAVDKVLGNNNSATRNDAWAKEKDNIGWLALSDSGSIKRGADVYGLSKPGTGGMSAPTGSNIKELTTVANQIGLNPAQYGNNASALYDAINNATKDTYAITSKVGGTGANKQLPHATIVFKSDGKGNLVVANNAKGEPLVKTFNAVANVHEGWKGQLAELGPLLIAGAAFGMPYLMEAIGASGVAEGTLAAANEASGLAGIVGSGTGTMAGTTLGLGGETLGTTAALAGTGAAASELGSTIASDLVGKSTEEVLTDVAKDIGSSIVRNEIRNRYGNTAGNIAGYGMNVTGLSGQGLNRGIANTLDSGGNTTDEIGALTSDQVAGGGDTSLNNLIDNIGTSGMEEGLTDNPYDYIDENGNVIDNATNVSTGASGFPLNNDILTNAATGSVTNADGSITHTFYDGSTITTDNVGNVINTIDNTGNVIGGSSGDVGNTGDLTGNNETTTQIDALNTSQINNLNTSQINNLNTSQINNLTTSQINPINWQSLLSGLTNYQTAGSAAQAAAAIYAANKQAEAAKRAQDLQQKRFELINAQFAPQRGAGYSALNQIRGMLPGQYQQYGETGEKTGMGTGDSYLTRQFTPQDLYAGLAPNYNFMLGQGQQSAQRQANLGGGALGGNAQAALQRYTQDYAGNAYQNAFGNFQNQRTNIYNTLAGIAGIGQNAQNTTAQAGQNATNAISQLGVGSAAAQAAGITGAANAAAGGLQNYGINQILAQILGQNQNVAQNPN